MSVSKLRPAQEEREEKKHRSAWKWILAGLFLLGVAGVAAALLYEMQTAALQAREISRYAASLGYGLRAGPSDTIVYPGSGPFDQRLGYSRLPQLLARARVRGLEVAYQPRFSPSLVEYASHGFFTPYREKHQAGLHIIDCKGDSVYQARYPRQVYASFDAIPPLVIKALLFIENKDLLDPARPHLNPAVNWPRFTRAMLHELARSLGLPARRMGGSTLATQMEKYRHSPGGITQNPREKLQQMVSASVRAYQAGPQTLPARQQVVLAYLNSVPLGAGPGYGEVHGFGDGFRVWFNADFDRVNRLLLAREAKGDSLQEQGLALRQVLSLVIAQRKPYYYLRTDGRQELSALTASYLRLMQQNGLISPALRDAALAREVGFRDFNKHTLISPRQTDKGMLMVRTQLSGLLEAPLYDLDRLDLSVTTTLQQDLQQQVSQYLNRLRDPAFASTTGLFGEHLLSPRHTRQVRYSFILFESTPEGNLLRAHTDNTDQPFDINEGSKLELGSTAKLRVFVTYLQVMAELHQRHAGQSKKELRRALAQAPDNLSRWALSYLITAKNPGLPHMLRAAMERRYSASPREVFFTGGGLHTFHNFRNQDNGSYPTVREALLKSINLPFIRLMRDLVRHSIYRTAGNTTALLASDHHPRRRVYLSRFADREGRTYLLRFWRKYQGKPAPQRLHLLLQGLRQDPVRVALVHRFLYPETDSVAFARFLRARLPRQRVPDKEISALYHRYGPRAYNLADQGYVSGAHPLELWLLDYLLKHPGAGWNDVVAASTRQRQEVYAWLFRTRFKQARDSRIRTMLELDAFEDIRQRWTRLGYPFGHLVPSYATALGSSGDRPAALAELMGIILNKGMRRQKVRIAKLHFAADTPYETVLQVPPAAGEQVLVPAVAIAVQEALSGVVDKGTARRLLGGFTLPDGRPLRVGGKTGTGDNRLVAVTTRGYRMSSRVVNRTATFIFFLGDRHFGTLTAFVPGREAASYSFTSSLPIQVLRSMAPILAPYLQPGAGTLCRDKGGLPPAQASISGQQAKLQPGEGG
ncbi:MAG: transglycosylase domain-containing protein [Adhaeribacter sp.]